MNVFVFETYLEYASPADGTVMRHILKELPDFSQHNILYQFSYDDLSPQQKEIIGMTEDPIAVRVANRLPARTKEDLRKLMVVTPAQLRLALVEVGIDIDAIDTAIAGIVDVKEKKKAEILWHYANEVQRNHPLISTFGAMLGKTEEEIDAIFHLASTLA